MIDSVNHVPAPKGPAGAAFRLQTPSKRSVTWPHADGGVMVRQGAPYLTVDLSAAPAGQVIRDEAWRVAQETLDIHAVLHREALATHRGECEYLTWFRVGDKYHLTVVEMVDAPWAISATVQVGSTPGRTLHLGSADPSSFSKLAYHPAFRFYRLSQLTDDLFDAFRNAYLCLECLVSDEDPKGSSEGEPVWLKRVLGGALASAVPSGVNLAALVDDIYKMGRLPLFHAKSGQFFYTPYSAGRDQIHAVFLQLNALLMGIFRQKFGPMLLGGWSSMSPVARDAMARAIFQFDDALFRGGHYVASLVPRVDVMDQPRRLENLWAQVVLEPPVELGDVDSIVLRKGDEERITLTFPEHIDLTDVASVTLEILFGSYNDKAPRPVYPR